MKKRILVALIALSLLIGPTSVGAQGTSLKDLVELFISLGIIIPEKAVQARQAVSTMGGGSTTEPVKFCYNFGRDLTVDGQGVAVTALSTALSQEGLFTGTTNIFDEDMAAAVVKFQARYGIRQTGYVGPVTRAKLNSIYGCGLSQPVTPVVQIPMPIPQVPPINPLWNQGLPVITVNSPGVGTVVNFDKGNVGDGVLVRWDSYTGDFENYRVYIGNTISNTEALVSFSPISPSANSFLLIKDYLNTFEKNLYGKTLEQIQNAYYVRVTAVKRDRVSEYNVAMGKSNIFTIVPSTSSNNPSITVLSPNGGDIVKGSNLTVDWRHTAALDHKFGINLLNSNGDLAANIALCPTPALTTQEPGRLYYVWKAGLDTNGRDIPVGTYKIIVFDCAGITVSGYSGISFRLIAQSGASSIAVLSPNGGETFAHGAKMPVEWTAANIDPMQGLTVFLMDVNDNLNYYTIVSRGENTSGKYEWIVPSNIRIGQYKVRVQTSKGNVISEDYSDAPFTITLGPILPPPPPNTTTVSASIVSANEDRAGTQYVFGPGGGAIWDFPYGNDWKWNVSLNLPTTKTVQSMEIYSGGNSWSTSNSYSYPVVVYKDGSQLNTAYGQTLGTYSGSATLTLYTQIANSRFSGGTLTVKFTDGTYASTPVGASAITADTLLDGLNFWLYEVNEDKVGTNGVFGPGPAAGAGNTNVADWKWKTMLSLGSPKSIKSVVMVHSAYGEAWSTSADSSLLGKQLYPLVISYKGKGEEYGSNEYSVGTQLASAYDMPLGAYAKGSHLFAMYGQRETTPFKGSKLVVTFTDESKVETSMPARNWPLPTTVILPRPTVTLSANPTFVQAGGASMLTWSSLNATSCTGNSEKIYTAGSISTGLIYNPFTFNVTCVGAGGTNSASVTVNVVAPLPLPPPVATSSTSTISYDGSSANTASLIQALIQLLESLK